MFDIRKLHIEETDSTNKYINKVEGTNIVVYADYQTQGRGLGSNFWESKKGENLLFSIKVSPKNVPVLESFLLSMVGALSLHKTLSEYTDGITIKWPNDIYWNDKKLSGTLIETSLSGKRIENCILGVGININQEGFESDAPNPISLKMITGKNLDCEMILDRIIDSFKHYYMTLEKHGEEEIVKQYKECLYRKEGFHMYKDVNGQFEAKITDVKRNGHIILKDKNNNYREYEFKELKYIL